MKKKKKRILYSLLLLTYCIKQIFVHEQIQYFNDLNAIIEDQNKIRKPKKKRFQTIMSNS